jgi:hypothetical protein
MIDHPELDSDQQKAADFIAEGRSAFALGGYAGSGKTTTAAWAASQLRERAVLLAPTNKAAAVLAGKTGLPVSTIHKRTLVAVPTFDEQGNVTGVRFVPGAPTLPEDPVVIVDEASMVSTDLWDLMRRAVGEVPTVLVGDPFQLPPVKGDSVFEAALAHWPSMVLDRVYRQKEGSAVLDYATALRNGWEKAPPLLEAFDLMSPVDPGFLGAALLGQGVVITYSNEIRVARIQQMRKAIWGDAGHAPQKGEPMIGYQTSPADGVVNGVLYTVQASEDLGDRWQVDLASEFFGQHLLVEVDKGLVYDSRQKATWYPKQASNPLDRTAPVTFAYAITGHAAQGSSGPT